jgi:cell wall-associated NlpC family hydrolase
VRSTRRRSTPDYSKLIGIPYKEKDCWGIVVEFYKLVFEINLPSYYDTIPETRDIARSIIYSKLSDFDEIKDVKERKFGDIVLIKLYGIESHIGVYLGEGQMLHTTDQVGCCIDRIARWEKLIVGVYRVKNQ